jgi:chemotaxis protein MotB
VAERRKKKCPPEGAADWLLTYSDMVTLLLTFFVLMFTTATIDGHELRMILAAFQGLGTMRGGNTLEVGKMAELGNSVMALPSQEKGRSLASARRTAISIFQPEIAARKIRVKEDERGLVITLSGDSFFGPASAEIRIEDSRRMLTKVARLLQADDLKDKIFRIEGHTDSIPTDSDGPYSTNWELSAARSINILKYLVEFGANEDQFQVSGLADTVPLADNDTEEGRAYNRRVDIVILTKGHL